MDEPKTQTALPSAFSLFQPSANALIVNIWTFLALFLIPLAGALLLLPIIVVLGKSDTGPFFAILMGLAMVVFYIATAPAIPYIQLKSVKGEQVSLSEALKASKKYFWRFYGLGILTGLITFVGCLLFIVPGIFMMKRYLLSSYYLYDQDMKIKQALGAVAIDSKAFSGAIWGILGVMVLIQLPGLLPFLGIITFVLSILYYCAPAVRYVQIQEAKKKG